jgi:hypothetical protein
MTRSFMAIARGDWQEAIDYHLFGPLLFASFGIALIHVIFELLCDRNLPTFYLKLLTRKGLQLSVIVSFLTYYLLRITHFMPIHHL